MHILEEVLHSIKHNKVRNILAGFGVAWGIFILILLLGTGKGFQEGIMQIFSSFAKNSIYVYGGQIAEGKMVNTPFYKQVLFEEEDIAIIKKRFKQINAISPELNKGTVLVNSAYTTGYFQLKGVLNDYYKVKTIKVDEGRLLNTFDDRESRRVALIGKQMAEVLFPKTSPLNQYITIDGTSMKVVGIIAKGSFFMQGEQNSVYVPYSTFNDCFINNRNFNSFVLTLNPETNAVDFEKNITGYLAHKYHFDINDKSALYVINSELQVQAFSKLFNGIQIFLWFIGLCLLLSGIVGISNIMYVIVQERTFEIGLRKAIGAEPSNILIMIVTESIIITTIAGFIGVVVGISIVWLINFVVASLFSGDDILFKSAGVDFYAIIIAFFLLVISGVLAGLLPAKKAAEIEPVDAIRFEGR